MNKLKKLQQLAENIRILYVEDNEELRGNVQKLLHKFFKHIDIAVDGEDGFNKFKEHKHPLVITDIKMPKMDGITLVKKINKISPSTKIIIVSAFDDKEFLVDSIEHKVFRYLKKPVDINTISDTLNDAVSEIKDEQRAKQVLNYKDYIFHHQSSMVVMYKNNKALFANKMFLDFFQVNSLNQFFEHYGDLGLLFIEHEGFLYNKLDKTWFERVSENERKHFYVLLKNQENQKRHFLLSYQESQTDRKFGVVSLEDITDLNLVALFDEKLNNNNTDKIYDAKSIYPLLQTIKSNSEKLELHNYYKGLSITNGAEIKYISNNKLTIKTSFLQNKAVQKEDKTIITSEILPYAIESKKVNIVDYDMTLLELNDLKFIKTSPVSRKTIRVVPEKEHRVSLFVSDKEYSSNIRVKDISIDSIKLKFDSLPAGLNNDSNIILNLVLQTNKEPLRINCSVKMLKKIEYNDSFSVVFLFQNLKKTLLVKYITKRQMAIIREFKGLHDE